MHTFQRYLLVASLPLFCASINAQASMRCGSEIINEGDTTFDVTRKCGQPDDREITNPVVDNRQLTKNKAVPVENWVYGPTGGMYRHLRFIDGVLTQIKSRRN